MKMFCDNNAAISVSNNIIYYDITKHVEIDLQKKKNKIQKTKKVMQINDEAYLHVYKYSCDVYP